MTKNNRKEELIESIESISEDLSPYWEICLGIAEGSGIFRAGKGLIDGIKKIKDRKLRLKVEAFIEAVKNRTASKSEKEYLIEKITKDKKGEKVLGIISEYLFKFDEITKAEIMGRLTVAWVLEKISLDEYKDSCACVEKLYLSSIEHMEKIVEENGGEYTSSLSQDKQAEAQLFSAGVCYLSNDKFEITDLGKNVVKFGLQA